jgi:hypothetical protein
MSENDVAGIWLEVVTGGDPQQLDGFYRGGRLAALGSLPGLARLRRLAEVDGPRTAVVAELTDIAAARAALDQAPPLDGAPAPQKRGLFATALSGAEHGENDGPGVTFLVMMAVDRPREDEYNRWYDSEHIPILLQHDGWLGARRYRCQSPVAEYVTIYRVAHPRVVTPATRAAVRATDWSRDMLASAFVTHTRAFLAGADGG